MDRWKYITVILSSVVLCCVIWFAHPAKERVTELEDQISTQYTYANFLFMDTVEELLEWNFSEPLTDGDEKYFRELSDEFRYIETLFFSGHTVHFEWRDRIFDAETYLMNYAHGQALSEEDIADLYQVLQATRFISRDFSDFTTYSDFYDAVHSEEHEMVERVKFRLDMEY